MDGAIELAEGILKSMSFDPEVNCSQSLAVFWLGKHCCVAFHSLGIIFTRVVQCFRFNPKGKFRILNRTSVQFFKSFPGLCGCKLLCSPRKRQTALNSSRQMLHYALHISL